MDKNQAIDLQALTDYTVKELSSFEEIDDIIVEICTRTGWHWERAQNFVDDVQAEHHRLVTQRRNRLIIPLGVAIMIGGGVITYFVGDILWHQYGMLTGRNASNEVIISIIISLIMQNGYWLFIGLAMLIGGAYGIGKALYS